MKGYFWVGRNSIGLFKSGVVYADNVGVAHAMASKASTTYSDDKYVIVRLERVE